MDTPSSARPNDQLSPMILFRLINDGNVMPYLSNISATVSYTLRYSLEGVTLLTL